MARFLIESPHDPERVACARVVEIFLKTGSHFLTHADWGCLDGEHKAWIIAEVDSKEEARSILPPALRAGVAADPAGARVPPARARRFRTRRGPARVSMRRAPGCARSCR